MLSELRQKKIAVLGFGVEGKTAIGYLSRHGIKPVLFDQSPANNFSAADRQFIKQRCEAAVFGKQAFSRLRGFEIIFKSPGIPPRELKRLPKTAKLTSQTAEFLKTFSQRTIGVTGTKGKGTTSTLIYEMLKADGRPAYLTGNIGKLQAFEIYDKLKADDWVVFELSSFQLREVTASPHIAVVLMTTSEHLNWHRGRRDYWQSKTGITRFQLKKDFAVVNRDYPGSKAVGRLGRGQKSYISRFGGVPQGCCVLNGKIVLKKGEKILPLIPVSELGLIGEHNWENACAASEAAHLAGCGLAAIKKVLRQFRGLEHRLEFAGQKAGIKYYNDSFSTIPETTMAAIQAFREPVVLLLGGSGKNSDFRPLARMLAEQNNLRKAVVFGSEAPRILAALRHARVPAGKVVAGGKTFSAVFRQARSAAKKGDVVLLSPACASFDMFKNYKQRGETFKRLVK